MMKKVLSLFVLFAAIAGAPAAAQEVIVQDGPPPALRKNLDALKAAINGTAEQYEAMAKMAFSDELLKSQTPAQRKADFQKMQAGYGTMNFNRIERNGGPDAPLQVFVKGAKADGAIWIGLDDETSKFISIKPEFVKK